MFTFISEVNPGRPICRDCGALIRPDVVWFGEMLPSETLESAFSAARNCDLFFSIGTSGVVYPAASLPLIAHESGAYVVEINPEETELSSQLDETILGSREILPEIVRKLAELRG